MALPRFGCCSFAACCCCCCRRARLRLTAGSDEWRWMAADDDRALRPCSSLATLSSSDDESTEPNNRQCLRGWSQSTAPYTMSAPALLYPWHIPSENVCFNVTQQSHPRGVWSDSGQVVILGDFSHMLLVLYAMFCTLMGHYIGISSCHQIVGGYFRCSHGWCSSDWWSQLLKYIVKTLHTPQFCSHNCPGLRGCTARYNNYVI